MTVDLPEGFIYRPDFLSEAEEEELLDNVRNIQFSELRMHDVVASGWHISAGSTATMRGYATALMEEQARLP